MIYKSKTADEAWSLFKNVKLQVYTDIIDSNIFDCTVYHCIKGLEKAIYYNWYDPIKFNYNDYLLYSDNKNGNCNWIIPNKIIAFSSPDKGLQIKNILTLFKNCNIGLVIRLNSETYDKREFTRKGINHEDLYFADGTIPSDKIIDKFFNIVEGNEVIAIHCKAGLGRTGTIIALYIMKHYNFTAEEIIGYLRLVRPGSVIGEQQKFLIVNIIKLGYTE